MPGQRAGVAGGRAVLGLEKLGHGRRARQRGHAGAQAHHLGGRPEASGILFAPHRGTVGTALSAAATFAVSRRASINHRAGVEHRTRRRGAALDERFLDLPEVPPAHPHLRHAVRRNGADVLKYSRAMRGPANAGQPVRRCAPCRRPRGIAAPAPRRRPRVVEHAIELRAGERGKNRLRRTGRRPRRRSCARRRPGRPAFAPARRAGFGEVHGLRLAALHHPRRDGALGGSLMLLATSTPWLVCPIKGGPSGRCAGARASWARGSSRRCRSRRCRCRVRARWSIRPHAARRAERSSTSSRTARSATRDGPRSGRTAPAELLQAEADALGAGRVLVKMRRRASLRDPCAELGEDARAV